MKLFNSNSHKSGRSNLRVAGDMLLVCGFLFFMAIKKDFPIEKIVPIKSELSTKMVGNKYGRLLVLKFLGGIQTPQNKRKAIVSAKCDCGSIHTYEARFLRNGLTRSCGCLQAELTSKRATKHGQKSPKHGKRGTIMYARWRSMFDRVRSDPNYCNVIISDRWQGEDGFVNFCADIGEMPTPKHTVDRWPNKKGNYEPGNVRWATQREQMQNVEKNVNAMFCGELLCLSEIARRANVDQRRLNYLYQKKGMNVEDAISRINTNKRKQK